MIKKRESLIILILLFLFVIFVIADLNNSTPTHDNPILNSTNGNTIEGNLTLYNQSTSDFNITDEVYNIISWNKNNNNFFQLYLPFENSTSNLSTTQDYSGSNKSIVVGEATLNYSCIKRTCYNFDGVNDNISTTATDAIGTKNSTIMAWFYYNGTNDINRRIIVGSTRFEILLKSGKASCKAFDTSESIIDSVSTLSIGWHHITCNQNYSTSTNINTTELFIDGKFNISTNRVRNPLGNLWYIGRSTSSIAYTYPGQIDEVFIFNNTISSEQINLMYNFNYTIISNTELSVGDIWNGCITPTDGIDDGTVKCSNNITIINSIPTIPNLISPTNDTHINTNTTTFEWSNSTLATYYELDISANAPFTNIVLNKSNVQELNYTLIPSEALNNQYYYWRVKACNNNGCSAYANKYKVTIDTINPIISWTTPSPNNTTIISNQNLTLNITVNDTNLYIALVNITNSSGSVWSTYITEINSTGWFFNNSVPTQYWQLGNYTVETTASDDHTYGDLFNLTYEIKEDKINLKNTENNLDIIIGTLINNQFIFTSSNDITKNNFKLKAKTKNNEYKWNLSFKKPKDEIKIGFAFKSKDIKLRNAEKGHFIWNKWYIDFEDMISTGYPINVTKQNILGEDYWIVYTSSNYCNIEQENECILDPTVGGLNIVSEYKNIQIASTPSITTPQLNSTVIYTFNDVNATTIYSDTVLTTNGTVYFEWSKNSSIIFTDIVTNILNNNTNVSSVFSSTNFTRGDKIRVRVSGFNSLINSSKKISSEVTISNSLPIITTPQFNITTATNNSVIESSINFSDYDNESSIIYFEWFVNNTINYTSVIQNVRTNENISAYLMPGNFSNEDNIIVQVTAFDNVVNSTKINSTNIRINSAPIITINSPINESTHSVNPLLKFTTFDANSNLLTITIFGDQSSDPQTILQTYTNVNPNDYEYLWNIPSSGTWFFKIRVSDNVQTVNSEIYRILIYKSTSSGNSGGGGSSGITSQTKKENFTTIGNFSYYKDYTFFVLNNKEQTENIEITNNYEKEINLNLSCVGDICNFLNYKDTLLLSSNKTEKIQLQILVKGKINESIGKLYLDDTNYVNLKIIVNNDFFSKLKSYLNEEKEISSLTTKGETLKLKNLHIYVIILLFIIFMSYFLLSFFVEKGSTKMIITSLILIVFSLFIIYKEVLL